jgi:hypothetical protein
MWLPAFNIAGETLQWKIVFVAKTGCGPLEINVASAELGRNSCSNWGRSEIGLANHLKPNIVVPVGLTIGTSSSNKSPSIQQFEEERQSMVKALAPCHAKILFLQEIPQFYSYLTPATPESCLAVHSSSIQKYELTFNEVKSFTTTAGLTAVATIDHLDVVPIRELFCGSVQCEIFVDSPGESHLVYTDWAHMDATYALWIRRATSQLLAKYLPG